MQLIVQKYGGTSVATPEARELVYQRIIEAKAAGNAVIAVVSAMGRRGAPYATDTLLELVQPDCPQARNREQVMIQFCGEIIAGGLVTANLQQLGYPATYLTGQQAGLVTSSDFDDAQILRLDTDKLSALLQAGEIVVVAGGQGATPDGEITSLGRGGSDITACALGVALDAARIEIYSDVEGVMTADPRLVSTAKIHNRISHDDCHRLALHGAKVMHPAAVEIAASKPNIPLWVRSIFSQGSGTLIGEYGDKLVETTEINLLGVTVANNQTLPLLAAAGDFYGNQTRCTQKLTGLSKVSLLGRQLLANQRFLSGFADVVASNDFHPLAQETCNQVLSVWVTDSEAPSLAQALHTLLE